MMIIAHVVVLLVLSIALVSCTNAGTNSNIQRFTLNLAYGTASPDGFEQRMMLANGQIDYPIVVNAGDSLEITVINNMDVPTSLHWHGMFQRGSPWYDGAAGITQCPIQPGGKLC
jgi:iron transport multicopper oxidase